jgi:hypothetical protein
MIAIHKASGGFSDRWIDYCKNNGIPYKIVNCYNNDIINQISGCTALMWQYYQGSARDYLMAKPLMNALEHAGIKTFPDFRTAWHFDDKVGQKYLLEATGVPLAPSWIFYYKQEALEWAEKTDFPKVFKLRGGAGSQNVRLVHSKNEAKRLIRKAFSSGFSTYDAMGSLKERYRLFCLRKTNFIDLIEGIARIAVPPPYAKVRGNEKGYIYFQEFISGNDSDIRIVVIGDKAFGIKRMVRENDFRASGSGNILYDKALINEDAVKMSLATARKLQTQCVAFDFVLDGQKPLIVEISFGFAPEGYDFCPGYWDENLFWHEGKFNPYGWMVETLVE